MPNQEIEQLQASLEKGYEYINGLEGYNGSELHDKAIKRFSEISQRHAFLQNVKGIEDRRERENVSEL